MLEDKVEVLETSFKENDSFNLIKAVKDLEKKPKKILCAVKDKQGSRPIHANKQIVLTCCKEHFKSHLNTAFPHNPEAIQDIPETPCDADAQPEIDKSEFIKAIKKLKTEKLQVWVLLQQK